MDTPSNPGGVSDEFKQRVKDRKGRERGAYASTKDHEHGVTASPKDRDQYRRSGYIGTHLTHQCLFVQSFVSLGNYFQHSGSHNVILVPMVTGHVVHSFLMHCYFPAL